MMNRFGQKIKDLRTRHDFTQQDLAGRIGIERPTLSRIETGGYPPSEIRYEWLMNFSKTLLIPLSELQEILAQDIVKAQEAA